MEKVTEEQIKEWERKYGKIYLLKIEDKTAYLKPPTRQTLSLSMSYEKNDPLKADEVLLQNCWISGDEVIKTDLDLFLAARAALSELVEVKKASLVKL